ncbi:MAG: gliding motility lipoprotein GldH [Muribaculaceae bacterium]|nr:gliding motility lipoprotein GldH [Muribaculaceae bacterium]
MRLRFHDISIIIGILSLITATGCRDDIKWSESRKISSEGWTPDQVIEFNLDPAAYQPKPENRFAELTARAMGDTLPRCLGNYQAVLAVRYLDKCNVARLDLIIEKAGLDESIVTDTLRIPLYYDDGNPVGKGRLGIFEASVVLPGFRVSNGTILSLRPATDTDTIRGISDITLLLSQNPESQEI